MTEGDVEGYNPAIVALTGLVFKIAHTKVFVPLVTLSKKNDTKLLEQLKTGFKRIINRNNINVNRLFALSFQRIAGENNTAKNYRDSFSRYYVPNARIKDFNVLIDGKSFFDLPVKNEEEAYEKIIAMSNNNDYTTGHLLDFGYFKKITNQLRLI